MSAAGGGRKRGRFGYLAAASAGAGGAEGGFREATGDEGTGSRAADGSGEGSGGGSGERGGGEATPRSNPRPRRAPAKKKAPPPPAGELQSIPKGEGRMKQERSQLNVRIPTTLKRRAAAKATLEGRDIGGVVEELLRGYLEG